jgi:hypothetical protein
MTTIKNQIKELLLAFFVVFLVAFPIAAQSSWGDNQPTGTRESASTGMFTPSRYAFDSDVNTYWQLTPGKSSGWVERYWNTPQRLAGGSVNLTLPEGATLQFSYLGNDHWVPIPGAVITGPQDGIVALTFPGEMPKATRLLARLEGAEADQAKISEIIPTISQAPTPYGKILPQTYTLNQKEYINLKASRLWDGLITGTWFAPSWNVPWEVNNTTSHDQPDVFPPYSGNPPQEAEIIWQLDGSYSVQTLKVFFIQNYQSIQFEFWDGSRWVEAQTFGAGWTDPGSGWRRIDLASPVTTTKIRITFPGRWGRAGYIGEVEVWGKGWSDTTPQSLVISPVDAGGNYHFVIADTTAKDRVIEVAVAGKTAASISGEWNGATLTAQPATWIGEDTIYRIPVSKESIRPDNQFLKLNAPITLHGVDIKDGASLGQIDLGNPYSDGQFAASQAAPGSSVPVGKNKVWTLSGTYQLETLRVFTGASSPGTFQTVRGGRATTINWTNQGTGWWEASLGGIVADQLSFQSAIPIIIDEIQLWGSPLGDKKVGMEVWWPRGPVQSDKLDGNSVIGWMGDPGVQPLIGTYHPRQADRIFWMPLAAMNLSPEQVSTMAVQGTHGSASFNQNIFINWQGPSAKSILDQGISLEAVNQATYRLSGSVKQPNARAFVQGTEVPIVGGSFSSSVTLKSGFQLLTVEIWDKQKKRQLAQFTKPVYRTIGLPSLQLSLPYSELWTQSATLDLSGLVGNGLGLSLSLNGANVPLSGNAWTKTITLGEGTQVLHFTLKDNTGREKSEDLTIHRVSALPTVSIQAPTEGQYLAHSAVSLQFTGSDPQYWWSLNGGDWQDAPFQSMSPIYSLADGFYTYTLRVQDRAGNISLPSSVSFCVDTTPPVGFAVTTNVTGWTSNNTPTITFGTTDATSGIDHYEYLVDTGMFVPVTSPFTLPVLSDGVRTVYVKAQDKAGNTTIENIDLKIDTSLPPTPVSVVAIPGADNIVLNWTGVDDGEEFQTYRIERSPAWSDGSHVSDSQNYGTQSLSDSGLAQGSTYAYRIWAVDRAGNLSPKTDWVSAVVGVASAPINTTGDTVVNFNLASVTLPQGVTAPDITAVLIHQVPVEAFDVAPSNPLASMVYHFSVERTSDGVTIETDHADFTGPVNIRISYDAAKIPAGYTVGNLKPFYYDDIWGRWVPIKNAVVDIANRQVLFQSSHFSSFSIQASLENEASLQQLRSVRYNSSGTRIGPDPTTVSPKEGTVSTGYTEMVLPGRAGFDLVVRRVYDTTAAQSDASKRNASQDGSYPWSIGHGWKLDFLNRPGFTGDRKV